MSSFKVKWAIFGDALNPDIYEGAEVDVKVSIEVLKDGDIAGAWGEASLPTKGEKFEVSLKEFLFNYAPALKGKNIVRTSSILDEET